MNLMAGIVGAIWLGYLGQWSLIFTGILLVVLGPWLISLALLPGFVLAIPLKFFSDRESSIGVSVSGLLAATYSHFIVSAWCIAVLILFASRSRSETFIPAMLWSYAVGTGPINHMARQEDRAGGGAASLVASFFAQVAYVAVLSLLLLMPLSLVTIAGLFVVVMALSVSVQISMLRQEQRPALV